MTERRPELWIVRHGETEWSASGQHTGRTDIPLTQEGERKARALRKLLDGRRFALVLSSPLSRARETCRLAGYGDQAETCEDLLEWNYGEYEGRTTPEIRMEAPEWNIWQGKVPGGETAEQVAERTQRVIERAERAGGDTIAFAHGHVLRVLGATWLGLSPDSGRLAVLGTAALGVLGWEHEWHVVKRWNIQPSEEDHG